MPFGLENFELRNWSKGENNLNVVAKVQNLKGLTLFLTHF